MKKVVLLMVAFSFFPRLLAAQELNLDAYLGKDWYGLYMGGQKAGYASTEFARGADGEVIIGEEAVFKVKMAGFEQSMDMRIRRYYGDSGELRRIEQQVTDMSGVQKFDARVEGDELVVSVDLGGNKSEKRYPKPKESLADAMRQITLITEKGQVGNKLSYAMFDPMMGKELTITSEIVGIEERVIEGASTRVFEVRNTYESLGGMTAVSLIAEDGTVLEDTIAGLFKMRLEPEAMARNLDFSNDVVVSNAALVDEPITDARTRATLTLTLTGPLTEGHLFGDGRQRLTADGAGFLFEATRRTAGPTPPATLPVTEASVKEWREASSFIQSDNPKVVARAKKVVGVETDAFKAASQLCHWVHENMRSTYSARMSNTLEVLENLEGDCTEHSVLFIGLARAAGIPAREVAGLVYAEGPQPGFYFHQWAKVWVGEWVDVDPTFDQPLVDVTHIKLSEGDLFEQIKLIPLIGQIKIDVID